MKYLAELPLRYIKLYFAGDNRCFKERKSFRVVKFNTPDECQRKCDELNKKLYDDNETPSRLQSFKFRVVIDTEK